MEKSTKIMLRVAVTIIAWVLLVDPWPLKNKNDYE